MSVTRATARLFGVHQRAALGVRDDVLDHRDRQTLAHARSLVDPAVLPRLERNLLDDLGDESGHVGSDVGAVAVEPRLLGGDPHPFRAAGRIMGADFRTDAILERSDDLAARGVVLGVGRERHQHVERQPHRVALNLDVAFLQDVEQPDLNLAGQIRQLVDRENPPVGPRQQPVMHRQLVRELKTGLRRLDRVDVADHVGNGHVGCRKLLDVPRVARQPRDGRASPSAAMRRPAGAHRSGQAGRH